MPLTNADNPPRTTDHPPVPEAEARPLGKDEQAQITMNVSRKRVPIPLLPLTTLLLHFAE